MSAPLVGYPAGWILGVIDDPNEVTSVDAELAAAGIADDDRVILAGPDDAGRLEALGTSGGRFALIGRIAQFLAMDQRSDFGLYRAALREGRAAVGVRPRGDARSTAIDLLKRHGVHFINRFGSWSTEEVLPWQGPMPPAPRRVRR